MKATIQQGISRQGSDCGRPVSELILEESAEAADLPATLANLREQSTKRLHISGEGCDAMLFQQELIFLCSNLKEFKISLHTCGTVMPDYLLRQAVQEWVLTAPIGDLSESFDSYLRMPNFALLLPADVADDGTIRWVEENLISPERVWLQQTIGSPALEDNNAISDKLEALACEHGFNIALPLYVEEER